MYNNKTAEKDCQRPRTDRAATGGFGV